MRILGDAFIKARSDNLRSPKFTSGGLVVRAWHSSLTALKPGSGAVGFLD